MARIRSIKQEWLEDESLGALSDSDRTLSVGLITLADDYGAGRGSVKFVASRVWAYAADPAEAQAKAASGLASLVKIGFIRMYEVDGQAYFVIRNWAKHQRVDKPGKTAIPMPPEEPQEKILASSGDSEEILPRARPLPSSPILSDPLTRAEESPPEAPRLGQSPIAKRHEALRSGYESRFRAAFPTLRLPRECGIGGSEPWLGLARELTDEQVSPLLDAFFRDADPFVAKDRAPAKLASQRVRLLTSGPTLPAGATPAPATPSAPATPERAAWDAAKRRLDAVRGTAEEADATEAVMLARRAMNAVEVPT